MTFVLSDERRPATRSREVPLFRFSKHDSKEFNRRLQPSCIDRQRLKSMSSDADFSVACWTDSPLHKIHVRSLKTFQRRETPGGAPARASITSVSLWRLDSALLLEAAVSIEVAQHFVHGAAAKAAVVDNLRRTTWWRWTPSFPPAGRSDSLGG